MGRDGEGRRRRGAHLPTTGLCTRCVATIMVSGSATMLDTSSPILVLQGG